MRPARGEAWLFDLGMAGKVRPALVISSAFEAADRALVTIVPHATSLPGSQSEIRASASFLKPGGFLVHRDIDISTREGDPKTRGAQAGSVRFGV